MNIHNKKTKYTFSSKGLLNNKTSKTHNWGLWRDNMSSKTFFFLNTYIYIPSPYIIFFFGSFVWIWKGSFFNLSKEKKFVIYSSCLTAQDTKGILCLDYIDPIIVKWEKERSKNPPFVILELCFNLSFYLTLIHLLSGHPLLDLLFT